LTAVLLYGQSQVAGLPQCYYITLAPSYARRKPICLQDVRPRTYTFSLPF